MPYPERKPPVQKALMDWLTANYPPLRLHVMADKSIQEIWMRAGEQRLIEVLARYHDEQEAP